MREYFEAKKLKNSENTQLNHYFEDAQKFINLSWIEVLELFIGRKICRDAILISYVWVAD